MISDICFQQIRDNYWFGQYGQFKVVMMKDNGYINASKLCKDGNKDFRDWKRNVHSQELINTLIRQEVPDFKQEDSSIRGDGNVQILTLPFNPIIKVVTTKETVEDKLISGTYCHNLLIAHIASWVSPDFKQV
jgi:hypothetical protein